jgi:malate permease and related proteins
MALGYLMRKTGILSSEADRSLTRLVVTLLAPCLALDTIIGNEALRTPANWILPPLLGFGSIVLGIAISRSGAILVRIPEGEIRRTFIFTTSLNNYANIPLPLYLPLFDRETMGVLFGFYLGVELACWSIALAQLTGHAEQGSWRRAINPPIVAIPSAILLNALRAKAWIPPSIRQPSTCWRSAPSPWHCC